MNWVKGGESRFYGFYLYLWRVERENKNVEDFRRTCAVHLFCLSMFIPSLFGSVDTSFEFCFENTE